MASNAVAPSAKPGHLEPSKLGTKQYWDELYATELTNHAADPSDEGTVWFDDSDAEAKMVAFLDGGASEQEEQQHRQPPGKEQRYYCHHHHHPPLHVPDKSSACILDLGCGNGSLLRALRAAGWGGGSSSGGDRGEEAPGRLLGVDYSEQSIALARRVCAAPRPARGAEDGNEDDEDEEGEGEGEGEGLGGDEESDVRRRGAGGEGGGGRRRRRREPKDAPLRPIEFRRWDLLRDRYSDLLEGGAAEPPPAATAATAASATHQQLLPRAVAAPGPGDHAVPRPARGWDLVLDKGTFDAISLSEEKDGRGHGSGGGGRRISERYRGRVSRLLRPGGLFLITSCNWTEEELRGWLEDRDDKSKGDEIGEGEKPSSGDDDDDEGAGPGALRLVGRVRYPSFSFGGVKGQTITTLCFVKEGEAG